MATVLSLVFITESPLTVRVFPVPSIFTVEIPVVPKIFPFTTVLFRVNTVISLSITTAVSRALIILLFNSLCLPATSRVLVIPFRIYFLFESIISSLDSPSE